jgi:hypothetical protein
LRRNQTRKLARGHREEARFVISFHRFTAALCLVCAQPGFALADKARDALVEQIEWLEQQASLVRSARCEFRVTTVSPLPAQTLRSNVASTLERAETPQIWAERRAALLRHRASTVSSDNIPGDDYHAVWLRKGIHEREERTYLDPEPTAQDSAPIVQMATIDGEFERMVSRSHGRTFASIMPLNPARLRANRLQPYNFAFEYGLLSHAQIVRLSAERQPAKGKHQGKERLEVVVDHPWLWGGKLLMIFDQEHRLVQRDVLTTSQRTANYALLERYEFFDHKAYDDKGGRMIWFPSTVICQTHTLETPRVQHITIEKIEFNLKIADEKFSLEFPQDAEVYDGVRQRWIGPQRPIGKKN